MEKTPLNIAGVVALPPESWVNNGFEAFVLKLETLPTKKGGTWHKATLGDRMGDYTTTASMGLFAAPQFAQGDRIRVTGQGIKRGDYQGKAQISMGKETRVEVIRVGDERMQAAANRPAPPAEGINQGPSVIHGATVGNAVKEVFRALTHGLDATQVREDLNAPEFWDGLRSGASQFIRVSQELEVGKLADRPEDQVPY